jgi:hypothetical protein
VNKVLSIFPRAMQNANDLNACGDDAVKDQIGELDQDSGFGRYFRPERA